MGIACLLTLPAILSDCSCMFNVSYLLTRCYDTHIFFLPQKNGTNPLWQIVTILAPCCLLRKLLNVAMKATVVIEFSRDIYYSISLLVAPSGLECILACQGNLYLRDLQTAAHGPPAATR